MLSCPRGEHCDRHPRFFAGLRLDCGNDHQLCVGCIRRWLDEGNDGKLCPMCRRQIANGGFGIEELKEFIMKLQADQTMTKMDPAMPLPTELTTEMFRFVDSTSMPAKLPVSRVIYSQFLDSARKSGWNTDTEDFGYHWSGGCNVVINETRKLSHVMTLRPFDCGKRTRGHHQVNYFEVKMDRFVPDCVVIVGLSGPHFLFDVGRRWLGRVTNSYGIGSDGIYYAAGQKVIRHSVEFHQGDVIGCGLINKSHWNTKRRHIFFTKNGQIIGEPITIKPRRNQLFPTVSLRALGTKVIANFGGDPAKPFLYNLSPHLAPEQRKGKKRKADNATV